MVYYKLKDLQNLSCDKQFDFSDGIDDDQSENSNYGSDSEVEDTVESSFSLSVPNPNTLITSSTSAQSHKRSPDLSSNLQTDKSRKKRMSFFVQTRSSLSTTYDSDNTVADPDYKAENNTCDDDFSDNKDEIQQSNRTRYITFTKINEA